MRKNTLKDWCWIIDYSNAVGQKDAKIAPILFKSRQDARNHAYDYTPQGGVVRKVKITILKGK